MKATATALRGRKKSSGPSEAAKVAALARKVQDLVVTADVPVGETVELGAYPAQDMRIWIPPHMRVRLGHVEHVDGYWRSGNIMGLNIDERRAIASEYRRIGELGGSELGPALGYHRIGSAGVSRSPEAVQRDLEQFLDPRRRYGGVVEKVVTQVTRVKMAQEREAARLAEVNRRKVEKRGLLQRVGDAIFDAPPMPDLYPEVIAASGVEGEEMVLAGLPQDASFPESSSRRYVVVSSSDGVQILTLGDETEAFGSADRMARVLREDVGVYAVEEGGTGTLVRTVDPEDVLPSEEE